MAERWPLSGVCASCDRSDDVAAASLLILRRLCAPVVVQFPHDKVVLFFFGGSCDELKAFVASLVLSVSSNSQIKGALFTVEVSPLLIFPGDLFVFLLICFCFRVRKNVTVAFERDWGGVLHTSSKLSSCL